MNFVIPAKAESQRVKYKNTRHFADSSLWLIAAKLVEKIGATPIISSESLTILQQASNLGYKSHKRDRYIANSECSIFDVLLELSNKFEFQSNELIYLIQPTSPLRTIDSLSRFVNNAEQIKVKHYYDLMFSCTEDFGDFWIEKEQKIERIRDLIPLLGNAQNSKNRNCLLKENGLYYAINTTYLRNEKNLENTIFEFYVTPPEEDFDINTEIDFKRAEILYKTRNL